MCWFLLYCCLATSPALTDEPTNLEALWAELADADAGRAYRAMWAFIRVPEQSVAFFDKNLQAAAAPDKKRVEALINDLSSGLFVVRNKANSEFERLGDVASPMLREALKRENLSLEARQRMEKLIKNLHGPVSAPDKLRAIRAVEALEHIGTAQACKVLDRLAGGATGARLTIEARDAIERLKQR